jgi:tetratricopeptide (TPR) repeat protein
MWSNAATELEMKHRASHGVFCGTASALMLLLLGGVGAAQRPQLLKNIELCNGADRTSPDLRIDGCTALINSGAQTPQSLVIAYNNRGNAYTAKGQYDRAVQDYDQSIKLNPNYARAFNNRGVAYQKKGSTTARSKILTRQSSLIPTTLALSRTVPKLTSTRANTTARCRIMGRQSGSSLRWKPCGTDAVGPAP